MAAIECHIAEAALRTSQPGRANKLLRGGHIAPLYFVVNQRQRITLKIRLSNGMLGNEPSGQSAIGTGQLRVRPAMLGDDRSQSLRVLPMNRFHARRIPAAEFTRLQKLLADTKIFRSHPYQLIPQRFVQEH